MTALKTTREIRQERFRVPPPPIPLTVAVLWPRSDENIGTLARTCDALNARIAVPHNDKARRALRRGCTIGVHNTHVVWVMGDPLQWLRSEDAHLIGVELAVGATPLADLAPIPNGRRTTLLLGHESSGIPADALALCDEAVEIPMAGVGNSLNVAVAGSLVAYRLAGKS